MGNWLSAEPGLSPAYTVQIPSGQRDDNRRGGEEAVEKGRNRAAVEGYSVPCQNLFHAQDKTFFSTAEACNCRSYNQQLRNERLAYIIINFIATLRIQRRSDVYASWCRLPFRSLSRSRRGACAANTLNYLIRHLPALPCARVH